MLIRVFLSILYAIVMLITYVVMVKRLDSLTNKHIRITEVQWIKKGYKVLINLIFVALISNATISIFLILTLL